MNATLEPLDHNALLEALRQRYPVFQECRPLALGSGRELLAAAPDRGFLRPKCLLDLRLLSSKPTNLSSKPTNPVIMFAISP